MIRVTAVNLRTELVEKPGSRLVAVGSVELSGEFRIEYIRVVRANDGRFLVAMPSRTNGIGAHRDVCHPISARLRKEIDAAVLNELGKIKP